MRTGEKRGQKRQKYFRRCTNTKNNENCTLMCLVSVFCWLLWHCGWTIHTAPSKQFSFDVCVLRMPDFTSCVLRGFLQTAKYMGLILPGKINAIMVKK